MFYKIILNPIYEISNELIIRRTDNQKLDIIEENNYVYIIIYNKLRRIKKDLLLYISKHKIIFPNGYTDHIDDLYVVYSYRNIPELMFKKKIKYKLNGYYLIPDNPIYAINKHGSIYNIKKECFCNIIQPNSGIIFQYPSVKLNHRVKVIHRILAKVFIPNIDYKKLPIVDHIDGNKNNYNLNNLRWCSYIENNKYAYYQNKRNDNIPILVKNLRTSKIKRYISISDACKDIGLYKINITQFDLNLYNIYCVNDEYYEFKKDNNLINWSNIDISLFKKYRNFLVKVIFPDGNTMLSYVNELSLNFLKTPYLGNFYSFNILLSDMFPGIIIKKIHNTFIQCLNTITNKIITCKTVNELILKLNDSKLKKSTIIKYAKLKRQLNNYLFRFVDSYNYNEKWYDNKYEIKNKPLKVIVLDKNNNNKIIFNSLRGAAKYCNVDKRIIKKYIDQDYFIKNQYMIKSPID